MGRVTAHGMLRMYSMPVWPEHASGARGDGDARGRRRGWGKPPEARPP